MGTLKTHLAKLHQKNYYKPTWRKIISMVGHYIFYHRNANFLQVKQH